MPIRLSVLSGLGLSHAIICVKAERVVRDEGTPGWAFIGRSGFGVPLGSRFVDDGDGAAANLPIESSWRVSQ